jgi:hypothetical protein
MTSTYTPRTGSIAVRAYAYLQRHAGEWIPNARLAETLQSDNSSIIQSLRTALERKLIERRSEGRLVFWRMPKAAGQEREPESDSDDDGRPTQRTVPAPSRDPALTGGLFRVRSAFDMVPRPPSSPDDDEDAVPLAIAAPAPLVPARPTTMPAPAPAPTLLSTRFAIWSDGHLEIERAGETVVILLPEETRCLAFYLERLGVEVPA